jgi:putative oxidoreductase
MQPPLARVAGPAYAAFRIVTGFLFAFHGAQKLFGAFGGQAQPLASMPGAAGAIELVCGVLVMVGVLTGIAAFLASGEMAVAYFLAHAPKGLWPIENGGELAVLYCFAFLYIAARGAGMWSLGGRNS